MNTPAAGSTSTTVAGTASGRSYHHGDLANALTEAATELARAGGPEAVVLREVARLVGVSAASAYRHFSGHGELIMAVKGCALDGLAAALTEEPAPRRPGDDLGADALRRLRAIGLGYVRFALAEPGLFRTAFRHQNVEHQQASSMVDPTTGFTDNSYQMLASVLDDLVTAGLLATDKRAYSEAAAWSGVHGLATLLLDGPMARLPEAEREAVIVRTIDVIVDGICPKQSPSAP